MGEGVVAPLQALMKSARPVKSKTGSDLLGTILSSFRLPNAQVQRRREALSAATDC